MKKAHFFKGVTGDVDWFVTSTDGYQSVRSAKCPFIFNQGDKAILQYDFSPEINKEITVDFNYKHLESNLGVSFGVSTMEGDFFPPQTPNSWKNFSFTYVSISALDFVKLVVVADDPEVDPTILIDNLKVTYWFLITY